MPPTRSIQQPPANMSAAMFTLRILYLAFMAGIAMFAVVVVILLQSTSSPSPSTPPGQPSSFADMEMLFAIILGAYAVSVLPASVFIVPALRKKAGIAAADAASDTDPDAPKLAAIGLFTTGLLLRAALVEGWGLFGTVTALLTENLQFLLVPALAVAIIGLYFPTRSKFERFYTESLEKASKESD